MSSNQSFRPIAVRYQVKDTDRAIAFYTENLGFTLERKAGPVGLISNNGFQMWLSGPGSSGSQPMATVESKSRGDGTGSHLRWLIFPLASQS